MHNKHLDIYQIKQRQNSLEVTSFFHVIRYASILIGITVFGFNLLVMGSIAVGIPNMSALFSHWYGMFFLIAAIFDVILSFAFFNFGFVTSFRYKLRLIRNSLGKLALALSMISAFLYAASYAGLFFYSVSSLLPIVTGGLLGAGEKNTLIVAAFCAIVTAILLSHVFFAAVTNAIESIKNQKHHTKEVLNTVSVRLAIAVSVGISLTLAQGLIIEFDISSYMVIAIALPVFVIAICIFKFAKANICQKLKTNYLKSNDADIEKEIFYHKIKYDNDNNIKSVTRISESELKHLADNPEKNHNIEIRDRYGNKLTHKWFSVRYKWLRFSKLRLLEFDCHPVTKNYQPNSKVKKLDLYAKRIFKRVFQFVGIAIVYIYLLIQTQLFVEIGAKIFGDFGRYLAVFAASIGTVALSSGFYLKYASELFGDNLGVNIIYKLLRFVACWIYKLLKLFLPIILIIPLSLQEVRVALKHDTYQLYRTLQTIWHKFLKPFVFILMLFPLVNTRNRQWLSASIGESVGQIILTPILSLIWIIMTLCMAIGLATLAPANSPLWKYAVNSCFTVVTYTPSATETAKRLSKNILSALESLMVFIGILSIVPALGFCLNRLFFKQQKYKALLLYMLFFVLVISLSTAAILINPAITLFVYALIVVATFTCMLKLYVDAELKFPIVTIAKIILFSLIPWFGVTTVVRSV